MLSVNPLQRTIIRVLCFSYLLLCTFTFSYGAEPPKRGLSAEQLEGKIEKYLQTNFAGGAEYQFRPVGSTNFRLPIETYQVEIIMHSPKTAARRVRVDYRLRTETGWSSHRSMWFEMQKIQNIYVAIDTIQKHQPLIHNTTQVESIDILTAACKPLLKFPQAKVRAKYKISAGEIICQRALESIPMIEVNQQIELLVPKTGFLISTEASALEQGNKGDLIKVRIEQSGLIVNARITNEGLVEYESRI